MTSTKSRSTTLPSCGQSKSSTTFRPRRCTFRRRTATYSPVPAALSAGRCVVDGTGTVELANSGNSYAGTTQVLAGTLAITGDANAMQSPITIVGGATLLMDAADAATMTSTFTVQTDGVLQIGTTASVTNVFPDAPSVIANEGTIRVLATERLQSVAGAGQVVVEYGTTTLAANGGFAGDLGVKSGAVAIVEDAAGLGSADTSVVVENGGLLQLVAGGAVAQTFDVNLGATLEVAAGHEFQESSRLAGDGQILGALSMAGTLAPGSSNSSTGSLAISENLTLLDTSRLEYQLGGTTAEMDFAALLIEGSAALDGILQVALVNGFTPSLDDSFELLTAVGSISGFFETLLLPELGSEFEWNVAYNDHSVLLQIGAAIEILPGDFNFDGIVDAADYTVWRDALGSTYSQADYDSWKSHFGQSAGGSSSQTAAVPAVPEPASLTLMLIAAMYFRPMCGRSARFFRIVGGFH